MKIETASQILCTTSAEEIFEMPEKKDFTLDMWGQYKYMTDWLDIINYTNGHTFDDPSLARMAMGCLGLAIPSLAYTCPYQTRDLSYYENVVNINLPKIYLKSMTMNTFESDNLLTIHRALAAGWYHMISGRDSYDGEFHANAEKLYQTIVNNHLSRQNIWGYDILKGRYDATSNLMALMALEMHDKVFGTEYSQVADDVLAFVENKLMDEKTGLFVESHSTGAIGYQDEPINPRSSWSTSELLPNVNGLALTFYHYYRPEKAEEAWAEYKKIFAEELLSMQAEEIADDLGMSYLTQLGQNSEALFSALLAAKEMNDIEFFGQLQERLFEIGKPIFTEGLLMYPQLGQLQHLLGFFLVWARAHITWDKLLNHDWENYYGLDYKKVR